MTTIEQSSIAAIISPPPSPSSSDKPQKDLTMPTRHQRIMVFDTETTGLMPKHKAGTPFPPIEAYPHIMQLSWIVYNVSANEIEEVVDEYVRIPDSAPISQESIQVHGITREISKEKGKSILPLLMKFFAAFMKCDCIVAHNLQFDGEIVRKEMWRNQKDLEKIAHKDRVSMMCKVFTKKFNADHNVDTFCTMMNTIQFCGMEFAAKPTPTETTAPATNNRKKFPRLNELYGKLFDTPLPKDMHNSIVDVLVCLRCFLKIRGATEMSEDAFLGLIKKHSRGG